MATPDDAEVLRRFLDARVAELWTSLPARVKTYDAATQTADLEPVVRMPRAIDEEDLEHEDLPVLPNVPVVFPRGGGASITWPLQAGDHVLVVFSSLSTGEWRRTGATADAKDVSRNGLGSAFALAGVAPDLDTLAHASEDALVLEHGTKVMIGADATEKIARDDLVMARIEELADAILNATPTANDGGAAVLLAAKNTLIAAGWTGGTAPPSVGADKGFVK